MFWCSSPTDALQSRIYARYLLGDQRKYFVPCPDCHEMQVLEWKGVVWTDIEVPVLQACYACQHCGSIIHHDQKQWMLERGEWRPTVEAEDPHIVSFHLPSLYSPFATWGERARNFVAAKGDPGKLQVWQNTTLAEPWEDKAAQKQDWQDVYARRGGHQRGIVPAGGLALTAGVDVQLDRLECEVVAWGPEAESWSVDYAIIPRTPGSPATWSELTDLLESRFPHASGGTLPISMLAIDSGNWKDEVYLWGNGRPNVMVCKGSDSPDWAFRPSGQLEVKERHGSTRKLSGLLHLVGTWFLKDQLMRRLSIDAAQIAEHDPRGVCHFPGDYGEEYFQQLCAEAFMLTKSKNGGKKRAWVKLQERNEALDCRVLAMAASYRAGLWRRPATWWAEQARRLGVVADAEADATVYGASPLIPQAKPRPRGLRPMGSIKV